MLGRGGAIAGIVLVFVVGAVLAGGIWYVAWRAAKRRVQTLRRLADSCGWSFTVDNPMYTRQLHGGPFGRGHARTARNVITGQHRGLDIATFDYTYKITETQDETTTTQTSRFGVWEVGLPADLPYLEVGPESVVGSGSAAEGFVTLDVDNAGFNRAYRVRCDDPKFATIVLTPRLTELMVAYGEVSWRIDGKVLWSWDTEHPEPEEIMDRLDLLADVVGLIPVVVWAEYGPQENG
jgi:hypothetical protein